MLKLGTVKRGRALHRKSNRNPRLGCLSPPGSQKKGSSGDRFRGLAWDKLPAAIALNFRRHFPVGEEEKGMAPAAPPRERVLGPLS